METNSIRCDEDFQQWLEVSSVIDYERKWKEIWYKGEVCHSQNEIIIAVPARIGLIGNPSDGFNGCVIATTIRNYEATLRLVPNAIINDERIEFVPNIEHDMLNFASLKTASLWIQKNGYYGATRLFGAVLNLVSQHVIKNGIYVKSQGFKLYFDTSIPRQVGLAGSSALCVGFVKCLNEYYGLNISEQIQANIALEAENNELGISCGLQDRVVQAFGGCVKMNFSKTFLEKQGHGDYKRLDPMLLPKDMWLAYVRQPKESGKVHSRIRQRYAEGDPEVLNTMQRLADLADEYEIALKNSNFKKIANLMDTNFQLRLQLYGEELVGRETVVIVQLAREFGFSAKLSGSGGCVVGLWNQRFPNEQKQQNSLLLKSELEKRGFIVANVVF
jgi:mevalonate kinase